MITLDFSLAIVIYLTIFLVALLWLWLAQQKRREKELFLDQKFIWFCTVCSYTYINTQQDSISLCPRCGSYNKKG